MSRTIYFLLKKNIRSKESITFNSKEDCYHKEDRIWIYLHFKSFSPTSLNCSGPPPTMFPFSRRALCWSISTSLDLLVSYRKKICKNFSFFFPRFFLLLCSGPLDKYQHCPSLGTPPLPPSCPFNPSQSWWSSSRWQLKVQPSFSQIRFPRENIQLDIQME